MIFEQVLERGAGVLTAAIGMMKYTATGLPAQKRHAERVEHDRFLETLAHRPADNATRTKVEDYGEVEPPFHSVDIRDIRGIHTVKLADVVGRKMPPAQEIAE